MPSPATAGRSLRERLVALTWHSLTVAWGYLLVLIGLALDVLPVAADFLNAPEIQPVIAAVAGPYASHWLKAIGVITVLARMRTLHVKTGVNAL